jgi:hypothetical protein
VVSAVEFAHTRIKATSVELAGDLGRREAGKRLAEKLKSDDLVLAFVLSDGQNVNGSSLVEGLNEVLGDTIPVTGGLAGDGYDFSETLVGMDDQPSAGKVAAIGFYGDRLRVGYGSVGGWDTFGPVRTVTRSEENVLFELDGRSALQLYKDYLGDRAAELPGSALLFPLALKGAKPEEQLVRTVLSVDDERDCMIFAGDIPENSQVQLMMANFNRIIDGAAGAAEQCLPSMQGSTPELAVLISCVGRKLILGQRVEEEIEEVREILGEGVAIAGFYSYGEISPGGARTGCRLHNQTMTITTLAEA